MTVQHPHIYMYPSRFRHSALYLNLESPVAGPYLHIWSTWPRIYLRVLINGFPEPSCYSWYYEEDNWIQCNWGNYDNYSEQLFHLCYWLHKSVLAVYCVCIDAAAHTIQTFHAICLFISTQPLIERQVGALNKTSPSLLHHGTLLQYSAS